MVVGLGRLGESAAMTAVAAILSCAPGKTVLGMAQQIRLVCVSCVPFLQGGVGAVVECFWPSAVAAGLHGVSCGCHVRW